MAELIRLNAVLVKTETTYGTDATPATTDGVQLDEFFFNNLNLTFREENLRDTVAHRGLTPVGRVPPGIAEAEIELSVPIKGVSGAISATNVPEWAPLVKACAYSQTIDTTLGAEKATYKPQDGATGSSVTIYGYSAGKLYKLTGCRGSGRITVTPGQYARGIFSLRGILIADPSDAALPAVSYAQAGVTPPLVVNEGLTLNAFDPSEYSSFELDLGVELANLPAGNRGKAGVQVVRHAPQFTTTILVPSLASFNPYVLRKNGTLFAWDVGPWGTTQYNKVKVSGPAGTIVDYSHSDVDGLAAIELTVRCEDSAVSSPYDAVSIVVS